MAYKKWIIGGLLVVANLFIGMFVLAQATPNPLIITERPAGVPDGVHLVGDIAIPADTDLTRGNYQTNQWTGGIVPYVFDAAVTQTNRDRAIAAMAEWEAVAQVDFVPRSGQSNYIYLKNDSGNWSYVGQVGGKQEIGLYNWNYKFIIAHELGHALGLWHEQERPDRDTYVTINYANIEDEMEYNFDKIGIAHGAYNFESIMHYDSYAFSINGGQTIVAKPAYASSQSLMGNLSYMSDGDKAVMAMLYPIESSVEGDTAATAFVINGDSYSTTLDSTLFGQSVEPLPTLCVGTTPVTDTIWFKIPSSTTARDILLSASGYDIVMAVYNGSPANLVHTACVDGYSASGTETIDLVLEPSRNYYIQVGGWDGASGTLSLNANFYQSLLSNGSFDFGTTTSWVIKSVPSTRLDDKLRSVAGGGLNRSSGTMQFKGGIGENSTLKQVRTTATIPGGWTFNAGDTYQLGGYIQSAALKNSVNLKLIFTYSDGTKSQNTLVTSGALTGWAWRSVNVTLTRSDVTSMTVVVNNKSLAGITRVDNLMVLLYNAGRADQRGERPAPDKQPTTTTLLPLPAAPNGF